jgi:hypothetical protein
LFSCKYLARNSNGSSGRALTSARRPCTQATDFIESVTRAAHSLIVQNAVRTHQTQRGDDRRVQVLAHRQRLLLRSGHSARLRRLGCARCRSRRGARIHLRRRGLHRRLRRAGGARGRSGGGRSRRCVCRHRAGSSGARRGNLRRVSSRRPRRACGGTVPPELSG